MGRTRRRGHRSVTTVLALLVLVLSLWHVVPAASFDAVALDRDTESDVVADEGGVLGLNRSDGVTLGTTERLVTVTNGLTADASVTVSLDSATTDFGDLILGGTRGDTVTFDLAAGDSQHVDFDAVCDESYADESVTFTVTADTGGVRGEATRSVPLDSGDCGGGVVYATGARDLRSVLNGSGITDYVPSSVDVVGPKAASLDGDGALEVPFVNGSSGDVYAVDANNETVHLLDTGSTSVAAAASKSRMAVGTWNGSDTSVFFAGSGASKIYRVAPGGSPTLVANPGNGAGAVAGIADVDGDGADELVFLGSSQQIRYLEPDGTTVKVPNGGVGSNNGVGVGTPADFDGDGQARIPLVDGSGNLQLITHDGTKTKLAAGVDKAPLAAQDWDGDGRPEVIYLDGGVLHVANADGTTSELTVNGSTVGAAAETGAA
ncbi:MAG: FG-GAP repeat domain-containing protein [Halobacteriaceae archaeon]